MFFVTQIICVLPKAFFIPLLHCIWKCKRDVMMEVGYLHFHVLLEWLKMCVNACKLGLGEYSK